MREWIIVGQESSNCCASRHDAVTCQQVTALLVDYIAEAMESQTRQAIEAHLRTCEACLAFLNTYRATIRATRALRYWVSIAPVPLPGGCGARSI